ncbi:hypothetical protein AOC36_06290 [Erysipelothrix larvae]|uniref:HTH marR-type domain-containing protein n=1 Tax=Erysipelothrix larvae TaxID=1514105 RepID=A0A0X8H044_9FIRM|nr:MarR family transcriptional regulator [Erysipelothrix larvae]AMC93607.1 hypothetical protein AOC36_06290 [Erysipelothrix larvae]
METNKRNEFFTALNRLRKFPHHMRVDGTMQFTELMILMNIQRAEEFPESKFNVKKIQKFLNISQSAVSQTIASLEDKGYIRRDIDPNDRRKFALTLTPLGSDTIHTMNARMDEMMDEIFESISDEEIKQFSAFTQKLVEAGQRVIDKNNAKYENKE